MNMLRKLLVGQLVIVMSSISILAQDSHVVDRTELATAVIEHAARQDADRADIKEALERPEVQDVAERSGLDLDRMSAAVATMDGADLERAATTARQVNDALVGGQSTITFSTTTIIIVLLVVILLIVAID